MRWLMIDCNVASIVLTTSIFSLNLTREVSFFTVEKCRQSSIVDSLNDPDASLI